MDTVKIEYSPDQKRNMTGSLHHAVNADDVRAVLALAETIENQDVKKAILVVFESLAITTEAWIVEQGTMF